LYHNKLEDMITFWTKWQQQTAFSEFNLRFNSFMCEILICVIPK